MGGAVSLAEVTAAQTIARAAMRNFAAYLAPGRTERELKQYAESELLRLGATDWWLHGSGALILCGARSVHSGPGDTNAPTDYALRPNDIVSADLVPRFKTGWGDFARTFFLQDGALVEDIDSLRDAELRAGIELQKRLHAMLVEFVGETTTFEQLYFETWRLLEQAGYVNLDYHDNFGHTIELLPRDRVTIARGVTQTIFAPGRLFTFEPHIAKKGSKKGFKHENIYRFERGQLEVV